MKKTFRYSLQRTMVVYFLLIGIAALLVGVEFVVDTQDTQLREDLLTNFEQYSHNEIDAEAIFEPIKKLRNKAVAMVIVILCVVVVVLTMFTKQITEPLQHMIIMARKIAAGDLSRTIIIDSRSELMELGNVINEMSSNLQEILLLAKRLGLSGEATIVDTTKVLMQEQIVPGDRDVAQKKLDNLRRDLTQLTAVLDYFNFYTFEKSDAG